MKTKKSLYATISIVLVSILAIQLGCKKDDPNRIPIKRNMPVS